MSSSRLRSSSYRSSCLNCHGGPGSKSDQLGISPGERWVADRSLFEEGPSDERRTRGVALSFENEGGRIRVELFDRKERPPLKHNIIDTSERARANYRYVREQHFGL